MADKKIEMISDRTPKRVEITGVDEQGLAKLMDDTAAFIREHGSKALKAAADDDDDLEMLFKRVDLGDFVILTTRS